MIIKKKLKDVTYEEFKQARVRLCNSHDFCEHCPLASFECDSDDDRNVYHHKDLLSEKALNLELPIEVEDAPKLDDARKEWLGCIISKWVGREKFKVTFVYFGRFAYGVDCIRAFIDHDETHVADIIMWQGEDEINGFPFETNREYTLEELGL